MRKPQAGFTIVELLIVIVVIAILAAITIVAYNGIQQRASNQKTTQALAAWIKGLQLYKVDNGRWPAGYVCLGEGYLYGPYGTDTSGTAQCRQTGASDVAVESSSFKTMMKPYVGNVMPTPSFVTARSTDTVWYRGLTYLFGGGLGTDVYIQMVLSGTTTCPSVAGYNVTAQTQNYGGSGNTYCYYLIGQTTDT